MTLGWLGLHLGTTSQLEMNRARASTWAYPLKCSPEVLLPAHQGWDSIFHPSSQRKRCMRDVKKDETPSTDLSP
jgi:hypothetical protein